MKKLILLSVPLMLIILFTACQEDEPAADPRAIFIGSYQMNNTCSFTDETDTQLNYNLTIDQASDPTGIILRNFLNLGQDLNATVSGTSFNITQGNINIQGTPINITGTGNINGTALNLSYSIQFQGRDIGSCTDNGSKQ